MIYCILMCGGKGTRMKPDSKIEKPLIKIKNKHLIGYLLDTLNDIHLFEKIYAAVSNNTQNTKSFINSNFKKITLLETDGLEYSEDYLKIIKYFKSFDPENVPKKLLFIPIDIPLISFDTLKMISLTNQKKTCLTIIIEKEFVNFFGMNSSYELTFDQKVYCYTGISMIDISKISIDMDKKYPFITEEYLVLNSRDLVYNINTLDDLKIVEKVMQFKN